MHSLLAMHRFSSLQVSISLSLPSTPHPPTPQKKNPTILFASKKKWKIQYSVIHSFLSLKTLTKEKWLFCSWDTQHYTHFIYRLSITLSIWRTFLLLLIPEVNHRFITENSYLPFPPANFMLLFLHQLKHFCPERHNLSSLKSALESRVTIYEAKYMLFESSEKSFCQLRKILASRIQFNILIWESLSSFSWNSNLQYLTQVFQYCDN